MSRNRGSNIPRSCYHGSSSMGTETTRTAATRAEATNRSSINMSSSNRSNRHGSSEGVAGMGTATTEAAAMGAAPFANRRKSAISNHRIDLYIYRLSMLNRCFIYTHRTIGFPIINVESLFFKHLSNSLQYLSIYRTL
jgi:hypothetical protein